MSSNNNEAVLIKKWKSASFYKDLLAHDLKNNIGLIRSYVDLYFKFRERPINLEKTDDIFKMIREQTVVSLNLVENVLKLSTLEEFNNEFPLVEVDIYPYLNNAIQFIKENFRDKPIKINTDSIFQEKIYIRANDLLLNLFENILINSVKHNDQSVIKILIKISEQKEKNDIFLKIEFIDNGIGIEDSIKKQIFRNEPEDGCKKLGFGLFLVKELITLYHGKIWVEDHVNGNFAKGSKFVVLIPLVKGTS